MKKILAISLSLVLFLCLVPALSETDAPVFKIGVLEPLSGQNALPGHAELEGIRYAHSLRPTVKVGGKEVPVVLEVADVSANQDQAAQAAFDVAQAGALAVLGPVGSTAVLGAGPTLDQQGIPALAISATNPRITSSSGHYFRVAMSDIFQGRVMARYARDQGINTVVVLVEQNDRYSEDLGDYFTAAFEALGGQVVDHLSFLLQVPESKDLSGLSPAEVADAMTADFGPAVDKLAATKPDAVFAPISNKMAPIFLLSLRAQKVDVQVLASDTWDSPRIPKLAGEAADGVVYTTTLDTYQDWTDKMPAFVTAFADYVKEQEAAGKLDPELGIIPGALEALALDAYNTLLDAVELADSLEKEAILKALYQVRHEGITGVIDFNDNGENTVNAAAIMRYEKGKIVFVEKVLARTQE